ncbi:MAG: hypothetical protein MUO58_07195 [Anaerolineales bacterium]|nr:hypothetical protein [Anaerolineales bacterium]
MQKSSLRILLVLAATWAAALCVFIHPLLGLLAAGLFALAEFARTKEWTGPGTMATLVPLGWGLYILVLGRVTSPAATILFASSGYLIHALYALFWTKKEAYSP